MKYLKKYKIKNREMEFPIFFPDATRAVVRSIDSNDLENSGIEGMVVNAYHLLQYPGIETLKKFNGIKNFINWNNWVVSDSGGFQLLSLIYSNASLGNVSDKGINFVKGLGGKSKKIFFTPEKSIEIQFDIGSDIVICLDDCSAIKAKRGEIEINVKRTIEWAKRSKEEFLKQIEKRKLKENPCLFAVIQGGKEKDLREKCANELIKIGFDGYSFGGWPLNEGGELNLDILNFTAELMPNDKPKFALGIGSVEGIIEGVKMGYNIFDCVLPTRDARHKRLYVFNKQVEEIDVFEDKNFFEYLYISKEKYYRDKSPVSEFCDCFTCQNYSKAYLRHLFDIEDSLAWRLATIHNLRFYSQLLKLLREEILKKSH
jgi:queuine tRNA-ribosyltransferase